MLKHLPFYRDLKRLVWCVLTEWEAIAQLARPGAKLLAWIPGIKILP